LLVPYSARVGFRVALGQPRGAAPFGPGLRPPLSFSASSYLHLTRSVTCRPPSIARRRALRAWPSHSFLEDVALPGDARWIETVEQNRVEPARRLACERGQGCVRGLGQSGVTVRRGARRRA